MAADHPHNHRAVEYLLRVTGGWVQNGAALVKEHYWMIQCPPGLQKIGLTFELKRGISLSNRFDMIHPIFTETGIKSTSPQQLGSRQRKNATSNSMSRDVLTAIIGWSKNIKIGEIPSIRQDTNFQMIN